MPKRIIPDTDWTKLFGSLGIDLEENGSGEAVGDCPKCGGEGKLYVNVETGLWDCKVCKESGNPIQAVRNYYQRKLDETDKEDLREAQRALDVSLQTLNRFGIAFDGCTGNYLIPVKNPDGDVVNLTRYKPGKYKRPLAMLPTGLFGLENISFDSNRILLLLEGPTDLIAVDQYLTKKKLRKKYDLLAVPGAGTFKPAWAKYFDGRKVRICYDADDAGRDGATKAAKKLLEANVNAKVYVLRWPRGYKKGTDLRDLIGKGKAIAGFTRKNCRRVLGESNLNFTRGDDLEDKPMEWLVPLRIPFGTIVDISGEHGQGKSSIAIAIAASATTGEPIMGATDSFEPFPVLYFAAEDYHYHITELIKCAGGNPKMVMFGSSKNSKGSVNILEEIDGARRNDVGYRLPARRLRPVQLLRRRRYQRRRESSSECLGEDQGASRAYQLNDHFDSQLGPG